MLEHLLGRTFDCDCGRQHVIETRRAVVARGAIARLGEVCASVGLRRRLLVVADPETAAAALAPARASLEAAGFTVRELIFDHHPVAGPPAVADTVKAVADDEDLVAVGAGTINDITKSAAFERGRPYVVCGTALSMNGYTSAISALLDGGIKRTLTSAPPLAVVLDLDICSAAPLEMTRAGLGDMLSKPFSEADWRLATGIDGGYYCSRPGSSLGDSFDRMCAAAAGIGRGDADALAPLAEAILASGVAMAMAGQSSPASGGEHLISHYWDMGRYAVGEHPWALHGTQVGVACCLIEPLHHTVFEAARAPLDIEAAMALWPASAEAHAASVRARHTSLPAEVVDGIVEQAAQKWREPEAQRARLTNLAPRLADIAAHCSGALLSRGAVRQALVDAKAPTEPSAIAPGLDGDIRDWSHVRDMRARYTVLDLAAELGVFARPGHIA